MQKKSSIMLREVLGEVKKLLKELSKYIVIDEAYLYGSIVKGAWLKSSDVDVVIVSRDFENMKYIDRLELIYRIEWRIRTKYFIEVIPLTPRELEEKTKYSAILRDAKKYWIKIPLNNKFGECSLKNSQLIESESSNE